MTQTSYKRKGGEPNVVPHIFEFNEEAIRGFMSPELADGVAVENTIALLQMGFLEAAQAGKEEIHVGDGRYQIKFPELALA